MGNQQQQSGGVDPHFDAGVPSGPLAFCGSVDQQCRTLDHHCRPDVLIIPCNERQCCESGCEAPQNLGFEDIRKLIRGGGTAADLVQAEAGGNFAEEDYSVPPDDPVIAPQLKTPRGAGRTDDSLFDLERLQAALVARVDHQQPERQLIFSDMDPPGQPLDDSELFLEDSPSKGPALGPALGAALSPAVRPVLLPQKLAL